MTSNGNNGDPDRPLGNPDGGGSAQVLRDLRQGPSADADILAASTPLVRATGRSGESMGEFFRRLNSLILGPKTAPSRKIAVV